MRAALAPLLTFSGTPIFSAIDRSRPAISTRPCAIIGECREDTPILVFELQPALVDPETGKSLGAPERQVGTIVIDAVLEKFSTAKITKGEGITRGLVLRFKAP